METTKKTTYHYTTASSDVAEAIEAVLHDQKAREVVRLFRGIHGRKRRNLIWRLAFYLANVGDLARPPTERKRS